MSMNAYTRKEQKYRADGVHVDYGYNAIHGMYYADAFGYMKACFEVLEIFEEDFKRLHAQSEA